MQTSFERFAAKKGLTQEQFPQKLINDGSETKRARLNLVACITALVTCALGGICLFANSFNEPYLEAEGILHESFYLVGIGMGLLILGAVILFVALVSYLIHLARQRH